MDKNQYDYQKQRALEELEETYEREGLTWLKFVNFDDIPLDKRKLGQCSQCGTLLYIPFSPNELKEWRIVQHLGETVRGTRSVPELPTLEKIDSDITILLYDISYNEVLHTCD